MIFPNVFKFWNMAVMLFKQKIKQAFPQWLIMRLFDNYFYIKIVLDLNRPVIDKNEHYVFIAMNV